MLAGENGLRIVETDASNKTVSDSSVKEAKNGENLILTIDADLQEQLYKNIADAADQGKYSGGGGVIMDIVIKDFTPIAEQISVHGLGFIQVKLPNNQRLHVWHPDIPRRACYLHSAIHNHRFSFTSHVLIGTQVNRRYEVHYDA
jgi:hypothetical protein